MKFHGITSLFRSFRNWVGGEGRGAGSYEADAVQTGVTSFYAEPMGGSTIQYDSAFVPYGNVTIVPSGYSDSVILPLEECGVQTQHKNFIIHQRTADKTRPENISYPVVIYLGSHA